MQETTTNEKSIQENIMEHFKPTKLFTSELIAELFYSFRKDEFLLIPGHDDSEKIIWYEFYQNRWKHIDKIDLKKIIMLEMRRFSVLINDDGIEGVGIQRACRTIPKIIFKMRLDVSNDIKFLNEVMIHLNHRFKETKINIDFDSKPIWAFENIVLELETGALRHGKPDDHCTMSCGINFDVPDKEQISRLNNFLEEVFPDPQIRENFLDQMCHGMYGKYLIANKLKQIGYQNIPVIFSCGDYSGASTMLNFLKECFGDYCLHFPATIIPGNNTHMTKRKFLFISNETTLNKTFKAINHLPEPYGKIFVISRQADVQNSDVKIPDIIPIIEFQSKFANESDGKYTVPISREQQILTKTFHCDPDISTKIADLKAVFLWTLFERRNKLLK